MPESKGRPKYPDYRPAKPSDVAPKGASPRWFAMVMVGLFVFGLLWIVSYYLAAEKIPVMKDLGNWNMGVGFAFIMGGFLMSTRWR
ncbi:MAG: cell division protein CrgA [Candidatus Nanopelagicales bacterium]